MSALEDAYRAARAEADEALKALRAIAGGAPETQPHCEHPGWDAGFDFASYRNAEIARVAIRRVEESRAAFHREALKGAA